MESITSAKNPVIRSLRDLKDRKAREAAGMILVEGEVMLREALKCGLSPKVCLAEESRQAVAEEMEAEGCRAYIVPRSLLESVCETKTPQGVCAAFTAPSPCDGFPDTIVALDGVQDPGNVGTIWRTADAAGIGGVLFGAGSADALSPKVQRAAMGSGFRLPFRQTDDLAQTLHTLRKNGYTVIVSDLKGEDFYRRSDPGSRYVLVIGNEAKGVSDAVKAEANMRVKLPMRGGAESLNAAIAAGILMYDLVNAPGR